MPDAVGRVGIEPSSKTNPEPEPRRRSIPERNRTEATVRQWAGWGSNLLRANQVTANPTSIDSHEPPGYSADTNRDDVRFRKGIERRQRSDSGPGGGRTHNLRVKSPLLCQLSYRPAAKVVRTGTCRDALWTIDIASADVPCTLVRCDA
jgi:hypothetical protein